MKTLLVVSDSHENVSRMYYAAEKTKPDVIIHLGDHISDAYDLQRQYPEPVYYMVKGNCDDYPSEESEMLLDIDGISIFITHGHRYKVKNGLSLLRYGALEKGAILALYGHTHQALIEETHDLWLMNPGQTEKHNNKESASFGIVTIDDGTFACNIEYLPTQFTNNSK